MRAGIVLASAVLCWLATSAEAIEGRYRVEGTNPGSRTVYRGEAIVRPTGSTYSIAWEIGPTRQVGTGILTGSVLSIVFSTVGTSASGVASFEVAGNRIRGGAWAPIGAQSVGTERWTPE